MALDQLEIVRQSLEKNPKVQIVKAPTPPDDISELPIFHEDVFVVAPTPGIYNIRDLNAFLDELANGTGDQKLTPKRKKEFDAIAGHNYLSIGYFYFPSVQIGEQRTTILQTDFVTSEKWQRILKYKRNQRPYYEISGCNEQTSVMVYPDERFARHALAKYDPSPDRLFSGRPSDLGYKVIERNGTQELVESSLRASLSRARSRLWQRLSTH